MLKLRTKGGRMLERGEIEFSSHSRGIVEVKRDAEGIMQDPHHDRVMELGARCGYLLGVNYVIDEAFGIVEELAAGIQPPERAEAFSLGAKTALEQSVEGVNMQRSAA